MSEIKVGFKIEADGSKGQAVLTTLEGSLRQVGGSAKRVTQDIGALHAGWAKLNDQFARQTAAKAWTDQLAQASAGAQRLKQSIDTTTQAAHTQNKSLADSVNLWAKFHIGLMLTQQAWAKVNQLAQTADTYTNLNSRLKLVSGTTQELARAQVASFDTAQRYNMALDDTGRLYTRLAPIAQNLGRSQTDLITLMSGVGAAMKVSGASAAEAGSTITQLTQSLAAATVQGADFNLLYDTAPAIVRAVEKALSGLVKQYGSLKIAMEKGAVSNQQLFDVLVKTSPEFQRQADTMQTTVGGALKNLSNAWTRYVGETDQANGSSRRLADSLHSVAKNLGLIMDSVLWPLEALEGWQQMAAYAREIDRLFQSIGNSAGRLPQSPEDAQAVKDMLGVNGAIDPAEWERRKAANKEYFQSMADGAKLASGSLEKLGKMQTIIYATAIKHQLDPALMLGIAERESNFNPRAHNPGADDAGLFQFIPSTWKGVQSKAGLSTALQDRYDPVKAADAAARLLKDLIAIFGKDTKAILAAYNAGPNKVQRFVAAGKDPSGAAVPGHVSSIMRNMSDWKAQLNGLKLEAGDVLDPKELAKATDDYYKFVETALGQRERLEDAQSQTRLANNKLELQALQQQAEQAAQTSERTIADVLQQQGLDAGLKAIADAQAQQERYLREAQAKAGGADTEATRAAQQKLTDIDALIAKTKELDQWDQRGADLQNQRGVAEQALAQARIAAGAQDLDLQKALSENQANYDAMRQAAIRDQVQREIAAATTVDQRNAAIQRAIALEQQLGLASADSAKAAAELKQKEAAFIANINAELEFQKQLYLQLQAAKAAGASGEGLSILASTAEQSRQLPGAVSAEQIAALDRAIAQTKIYQQAIGDLSQTQQDREESVREQQLRENAYWDQLINRMEQYAATWREITGSQDDAFSRLAIQTNQYAKSVNQIGKAYEDLNKTQGDKAGVLGIAEGAAQGQAALNLMAQTMIALREQYAEGTQGYEDMTAAAERMMEVQRALQLVEAVLGVVHQATSGEVYTAIPRMMGVAAMMAAMGLQTGLSGGANASVKYATTPGQQDSGVFGDPSKASESILDALEIVRDNSSNDLSYSAAMLRALEGIEAAMKGVTNSVIRGVQPVNVKTGRLSGLGDLDAGGIDPLGAMIGNLIFSTYRKIADFGIQASQQMLSDVLTKGFSGQVYTDIETTTKVLGMTVSKSVKTAFSDLDPTVARQFTKAFQSIGRAVTEAGKAFGLTAADFNQRLKGFVVDMGKISTKDLTGEQLQEKITQMFSEQSDRIARKFMPKLGPFQQVGEGYFTTFIRVAEAVNRAGGELERLGITAINFRQVVDKQGDVAAEIVRQSLLAQEGLSTGVRQYIDELTGTATDIIDAYKKLKDVVQGLRTAGLGTNVTRAEINAGGGLDSYLQSLNTYIETFLTPSEQVIGQWQNIGDAFTALGLKMPTTNAEFRKLVEGIDVSTEAGQKLRGAVKALSDDWKTLQAAMDDAMSSLQDAYATAKQQSQDLRDYLASLKTGQDTGGSVQQRYLSAKALYEETLRKAQAGDPAAIAKLREVSASFLDLSKQYFGATAQFAADMNNVQVSLGGLADVIDAQIAQAEAQVPALKDNTDALTSLKDALNAYEATLAKVNNIQSSQKGKGVDDINAGNGADEAAKKAQAERQRVADLYENQLNDMVRELRKAQENGNNAKIKELKASIAWLEGQVNASAQNLFAAWTGKRFDVQLRAKGGYTPPGLTLVGEQGPELVRFTQPSHIHPAAETARLLRDSGQWLVDSGKQTPSLLATSHYPLPTILAQARAVGGDTPPGLTLVGERGPELVDFTRPSMVYTAEQTQQALGMDTSKLEARLEALERALGAGLRVDQAGYQALREELQALRAELAEQTRTGKIMAAAK